MQGFFWLFVFSVSQSLMSGSQREERKNGGKGIGLFNPKDIASAREGGTCNQCSKIPASVSSSSIQSTDPLCLDNPILLAHPGSHKLCTSCSRNTRRATFHGLRDWKCVCTCTHAHSLSCPNSLRPHGLQSTRLLCP